MSEQSDADCAFSMCNGGKTNKNEIKISLNWDFFIAMKTKI
jgi:hypothetical protein